MRDRKRLDDLVTLINDRTVNDRDPLKRYVGLEHITPGGTLIGSSPSSMSTSTNSVFQAGDVLFGKLRPHLRKSIRASFDGYSSTDILILRPNNSHDPEFVSFVLRSEPVFKEAIRTEEGTKMPRCSWHSLKKVEVFCPKPKEQRRIAEILSTLDETIEQTEALIAKYQQIKAGLMHDLFTRGLTPDGRLRPTRTEATHLHKQCPLGWIPNEWEVITVGEAFDIQLGKMLSKAAKTGKYTAVYLGNRNVQWDHVDTTELESMDFSPDERRKFDLLSGDLLMCEGGDVGRTALWRGEIEHCFFQKAIHRLRPKSDTFLNAFALRYFRFAKDSGFFTNYTSRSSIAHLTREKLASMAIFRPSQLEQQAIATRVNLIDQLLVAENNKVSKLSSLKSGLMQDLLTGRVRVPIPQLTTA